MVTDWQWHHIARFEFALLQFQSTSATIRSKNEFRLFERRGASLGTIKVRGMPVTGVFVTVLVLRGVVDHHGIVVCRNTSMVRSR